MRALRAPLVLAAALLVGALTGIAAAVLTGRTDPGPPARGEPGTGTTTTRLVERPEDAAAFLAAWERSRTATYVVESRFVRQTRAGASTLADIRVAQRPPDRLVTGGGTLDGRLGGRRVACAADDEGVLRCRDGGEAPPYHEEVARERRDLERLVAGDQPLYAVGRDGEGCFVLRLTVIIHAPPYGVRARFCYDDATGAPTRVHVHGEDFVDRTDAIAVRAEVTDDDLRLPDSATFG